MESLRRKTVELLAPARDYLSAVAAVDYGADAVYMGGAKFGARQAAGNAAEEIARAVGYAHRYGVRVQGADEIALTKLDVLSGHDKLPVCVAYDVNGNLTKEFPFGADLDAAKPVFEYLPGWNCDISKCRKPEDLPKEAMDYVRYIEKEVGCKIRYVSVGAEREAYIEL